MTDDITGHTSDFIEAAGDIVSAYVSNNHVAVGDLPALVASVHAALIGLVSGQAAAPIEEPTPAQIRKSVGQDGIVSFIDGRAYKTLKRHLTAHGLTPATYCERYGLPAEYPMVAPSYSEQRSSLAKAIGLGVPGSRAEKALLDEPAAKGRRDAA